MSACQQQVEMRRYVLRWMGWLLLIALLVGCQRPPQFVNHPRPELTVEFADFESVGCPPDKFGRGQCGPDSPLTAFGCDRIKKPSDRVGGLEPSFPIVVCFVEPIRGADGPASVRARTPAKGEYFYRDGGLYPVYIRYVLIRDGGFQLVKNEEEFRAIYAPIESPDEALSYALAMRNLSAYYGLEYNREYEYFVDEIEDTHVETVADGYSVHLYHYQLFGCGPHNTYAIELLVDPQGTITQVAQEAVFKDPSEDGLCVD